MKNHLEDELASTFRGWDVNLFLQGSYRNHTTTYGNSDVDIVARLGFPVVWGNGTVRPYGKAARSQASPMDAWRAFHREALQSLEGRFGWFETTDGRRAIKVSDRAATRHTDVLIALQAAYKPSGSSRMYSGITFPDVHSGDWILNFPKRHFKNGAAKNEECGGNFRRTVRMFKNARATSRIDGETAPGYFISCLLYNVPSRLYTRDEAATFFRCLKWLSERAHRGELDQFVCQHQLQPLFGPRPEQWNKADAEAFLKACRKLWFEGA